MGMRDLLLAAFVFGALPFVLARPHVGALMWAWIGLMNVHRLAYDFARFFPFAQVVAITTLIATVLSRRRLPFPWGPIPVLLILLLAWMSVTTAFAMGPPADVLDTWQHVMKIHLMLLVTLMLIRGRRQIEQLVWVIVVSIGFFGVKGGLWTVLHGGEGRVWGPPGGAYEDNNAIGLALVVVIPLMYYLMTTASRRMVRNGLFVAIVICGFAILGTQSRGAFLAIVAAVAMLALKSRRMVLYGLIGAVALAAMIAFMPEKWSTRMETIDLERTDRSATMRLQAWRTLWNLVQDRPILGGGFETAIPEIFERYSPVPDMPVVVAHSTYLQALGSHGFPGLFLYLALMWVTWRRASRVSQACRAVAGLEWADLLMRMTQVSLMAFAVGGAFLSLLNTDLPFYLVGLVVMVEATVKEQLRVGAPQPAVRRFSVAAGRKGSGMRAAQRG